eukprot:9466554-Pyramimonas_sp.AAC.1
MGRPSASFQRQPANETRRAPQLPIETPAPRVETGGEACPSSVSSGQTSCEVTRNDHVATSMSSNSR